MNKTNIRRVAVALLTGELATRKRGEQIGYNQSNYRGGSQPDNSGHSCNTTACIAGTAAAMFKPALFRSGNGGKMYDFGRKLFGLSYDQASNLFTGVPSHISTPDARAAALVLFNLAETGKVNWEVAV